MKRSAQAKAVANYFLEKAEQEGKPITPLQIQKLVYIAYGWYLLKPDGFCLSCGLFHFQV